MNSKLFVYGTLLDPDVRKRVLGHCPSVRKASLQGFILSEIELDRHRYPIVFEDPESEEIITGGVFEVTNTDLFKLDHYESDAYRRKMVKLMDGSEAWVYYR